jgi:hypothetical protein
MLLSKPVDVASLYSKLSTPFDITLEIFPVSDTAGEVPETEELPFSGDIATPEQSL